MVSDTTKMIRPKPRAAMPGTKAWASSRADSTLTACTRRQIARSTVDLAREDEVRAAAGAVSLVGGHLIEHGGGLTNAIVFGRIAGTQAAERAGARAASPLAPHARG